MTSTLRVAVVGFYAPADAFPTTLLGRLLAQVAGRPLVMGTLGRTDLVVAFPFAARRGERELLRAWLTTPPRRRHRLLRTLHGMVAGARPGYRPLVLSCSGENTRWNAEPCDFAVSMDLGVDDPRHLRWPHWLDYIDWSSEGLPGGDFQRFGKPLSLDRLTQPPGDDFRRRPHAAALICQHLREPRAQLFKAVSAVMPATGFGWAFSPDHRDHSSGKFRKADVLREFAFNLCPENALYPGYYTEKVPEAVAAGCVPLAWADQHVQVDFDPNALINLHAFAAEGYEAGLRSALADPVTLDRIADTPLFRERPSMEPARAFLRTVVTSL